MSELLKELENGARRQLFLAGKVNLKDDSFEDEKTSSKGWTYRRAGFAVKVGENRSIYVGLMGGYSKGNPVVRTQNKNNESIQLNWQQRNNPTVLENIADYAFIKISLEKDDEGKLIQKKFVSEYDAIKYLEENLQDEMNVKITATADYSIYNDDTQRSFKITNLTLDEGYTDKKTGEKHEARTPVARLMQTYLISSDSVSEDYINELEEKGVTTISAWVPQYLSKLNGESLNKVVALPQNFTVRVKDDNLKAAKLVVEKLLTPEADVVREITTNMDVLDGYSTTKGEFDEDDLDEEVRELLEAGVMTKEQINSEMFVAGDRISETTFLTVKLDKQSGKVMKNDKYDTSVLLLPSVDEDEEEIVDSEVDDFDAALEDEDFAF